MREMGPRKKQPELDFGRAHAPRREHGGDVDAKLRKLARPLDAGLALHVVLHSSRARGEWSFLHRRNRSRVEKLLYSEAPKNGVRLDRIANVGNHLHLLLRYMQRADLQRFFRVAAGLIARAVTGARKGRKIGKFWDSTLYSRLVTWGREWKAVCAYFVKNNLEAIGFRGARLRFTAGREPVVVVGRLKPGDASREYCFLSAEQRKLVS